MMQQVTARILNMWVTGFSFPTNIVRVVTQKTTLTRVGTEDTFHQLSYLIMSKKGHYFQPLIKLLPHYEFLNLIFFYI